tara:strand:+ start:2324 stop:2839 length:516 start_codon:yes stop_codon:yes gene_type:complete
MKKFLFFIFFFFSLNYSFADDKIVYLDINKIINESKAGMQLNEKLKKLNNENINEFKNFEKELKSEEENILKQKNILKEEEFTTMVNNLKKKVDNYNEIKKNKNNDLKNKRDKAAGKILVSINEILNDYSTKHSISLIIDKKNIVLGKTQLDITDKIIELLNKKISNISLN